MYSFSAKVGGGGGARSTMDSVLASHPAAMGLILSVPKNFSLDAGRYLLMAQLRKVDRDLIMSIEPIYCWLVAS